jgi:tetratricopeptide (TPR) repeat protein
MKRILATLVLAAAALPAVALDSSIEKYIERGDKYMGIYQFQLAAQNYKLALMRDPENAEAWEKHKQAVERMKAVGHYLDKNRKYVREGRYEEAQDAARNALKLDPRNISAWKAYEHSLAKDPDVIVIQSERDAWDAYRDAKALYESGHIEAANKYLDQVYKFTQDPTLKYYTKSYMQKVQLKMKERYPSARLTITDK